MFVNGFKKTMYLNIHKCALTTYTCKVNFIESAYILNSKKLEQQNKYKDLGVYLQSNLNFNQHLENASLFRWPQVEVNIDTIEKVQKRILR